MSLLLVIIGAFLNAVMDLLENENFNSSIFRRWNPAFWYKRESWKYARKIYGYKIDGWHISKSGMIILLLIYSEFNDNHYSIPQKIMMVCLLGMAWNMTFNMSYEMMKK